MLQLSSVFYYLILFLPSLVSTFWFVFYLLNVRNNSKAQNCLMIMMLINIIVMHIQAHYVIGFQNFETYYKLDITDCFFTPLLVPLAGLYFAMLTSSYKPTWKASLLFIPSLLLGISTLLLYIAMGETNAVNYTRAFIENNSNVPKEFHQTIYQVHNFVSNTLFNALFIIQLAILIIYSNYKISKYHKALKNYYSMLEDKSISKNRGIFVWANLCLLFSLMFYILWPRLFSNNISFAAIYYLLWAISLYGWCYSAHNTKYTVEDFIKELQQAKLQEQLEMKKNCVLPNQSPYNNLAQNDETNCITIDADKFTELWQLLTDTMKEKKLFLQPNLRMTDLASHLHTNRTYLSQVIREKELSNFSDYINQLRVSYAKGYMLEHPDYTLESVAADCGFFSTSSFYKSFKKNCGDSPKAWQLKHKKVNL